MGMGADEQGASRYCTGCAASLAPGDRRCPQCHRVQRPERVPSSRWVGVVAAGSLLTLLALVLTGGVPESSAGTRTVVGVLALLAWAGTVVGLWLDLRYVTVRTRWQPTTLLWRFGVVFPVLSGVVAGTYLLQRWRGLRESTGRRVTPDREPGTPTAPPPPNPRDADPQERG